MMERQSDGALTVSSVKRIHGLAVVTISNGESFSMPRAMLKERPYRAGMPFEKASFMSFLIERAYPFAMDKAVALLASRARTEREIVDALKKNAYPEETIARVMARLTECGYINDADFAVQWTSSRVTRGMGSRRIYMELRKKGVAAEEIEHAIASIDEESMLEEALKIAKKAAAGKDLSSPADRQKIVATLIRRGYSFQTAKDMLKQLCE